MGNNQLWRPLAAKVKGHHSGLPKNGQLTCRCMHNGNLSNLQTYFRRRSFLCHDIRT